MAPKKKTVGAAATVAPKKKKEDVLPVAPTDDDDFYKEPIKPIKRIVRLGLEPPDLEVVSSGLMSAPATCPRIDITPLCSRLSRPVVRISPPWECFAKSGALPQVSIALARVNKGEMSLSMKGESDLI
jgi:hypothetical protein